MEPYWSIVAMKCAQRRAELKHSTDGKSGAATVQCDNDIDVIKPEDKD